MAKYRKLTKEELEALEKEFVDFLIVNGIDAGEWIKMKDENPDGALQVAESFSDVVFEKVLRKTDFLLRKLEGKLFLFKFEEELAHLIIANFPPVENWNALEGESLKNYFKNNIDLIRLDIQEKGYQSTREEELFKLIQSGCEICDAGLFEIAMAKLAQN